MRKKFKVIAFDADDTLWENEHYFKRTEEKFCELLSDFLPKPEIQRELYTTELGNLSLYGYGIKGFILSLLETAIRITADSHDCRVVNKVIALGKEMLNEPVVLMPGIEQVLKKLQKDYRLIVATKGDLLDQERKLKKSGLLPYFHHIEIMIEKDAESYRKLLKHLDIKSEELLMIGNSLKSDVLPVLAIGGHAVHIPFHLTSIHEQVKDRVEHPNFHSLLNINEIPDLLSAH